MGTERPLTGVGVGNFRYFVGAFCAGTEDFLGLLGDPHDYYLKPLAELGIIGLVIFLWICGSVWGGWRKRRSADPASPAELRHLAIGAGLLGLAIDMVFQHALVQTEMQIITASVVALALLGGRSHASG